MTPIARTTIHLLAGETVRVTEERGHVVHALSQARPFGVTIVTGNGKLRGATIRSEAVMYLSDIAYARE